MNRINMLPPGYGDYGRRVVMIARCGIVFIAALMISFIFAFKYYDGKTEKELAEKLVEFSSADANSSEIKPLEKELLAVSEYVDTVDKVQTGRELYSSFLKETLSSLPGSVWPASAEISVSAHSLAVDMKVSSGSSEELEKWTSSLKNALGCSDVSVGKMTVSESQNKVYSVPVGLVYTLKND
jgi:Tfp pilus assembly protein PilN